MKIKFKLFANFREAVGQKEAEVATGGKTVGDAIRSLIAQHPKLEPLVYQDGHVKQYVNVLLNGQTVKDDQLASATVKDGDEIALFPPVSGG
ncbi:MAG TPA: ubiquitin-like small modifier protein 1 [Methanocella sp.]|jgi:molybdopterin synthase sulfur carrier subunit